MKKLIPSAVSIVTLAVFSTACSKLDNLDPIKAITKPFKSEKKKSSRVTNSKNANEQVNLGTHTLNIMSQSVINQNKALGKLLPANSEQAKKMLAELPSTSEVSPDAPGQNTQSTEESLLVGLPISIIGEQNVFGAVITKVSDKTSEDLGGLKLTDLPTLHVRTIVGRYEDGSPNISLVGCANDCSERAKQGILISLPIDSVDVDKNLVYIDLKTLGQGLDLMSIMDPEGEGTGLRTVKTATTEFNSDVTSLLFDVKSSMIPKATTAENEATAPVTEITVRWYMKLASSFNPAFESRAPTQGVGFFQTQRGK
ncbi:MAG: hypothetical protein ACJ76H_02625, partial [Bacteriovoracaceae bacterium]